MSSSQKVLLLHGTPLSPVVWDEIGTRLAEGHLDVAAPSLAHAGDSRAHARRIAATLGPAPVHVVGHSFGGQVALDLALDHPELVASLTCICSRATPYPPFSVAAASLRAGLRPDPSAVLARWLSPAELPRSGSFATRLRQQLHTVDLTTWADALESIARFDRLRDLEDLSMPILAVAAEHDGVSTPSEMRRLAATTRGRFLQLPEAGHMGPFLRPEVMAAIITRAVRAPVQQPGSSR
ncbi:alpha/beta fold hydrolase [Curtobacterium sp. L1-20]|uniref:alpha/beta fold hydrolase n=1 Tax=Curtobacterium sp. L1-20 TaxID=3138181 RepID=UPI003B518DF6